ncbi:MAG: HDOD domain-containing protein [Polyangiaceae bacterium]
MAPVQLSLLQRLTAPDYRPPVLPAVAVRLIALSRRSKVSTREIASLIEQDPVIALDMLRVSQSAMMALSTPIRTVEEALVRLGIRRSTELFVQAALRSRLFRCSGYEATMERLRKHSVASAEIARWLCEALHVEHDGAYLVGLLHDVGIAGAILAIAGPARYPRPPSFESAWPDIREHRERFALHLVVHWQLPKELRAALTLHLGFGHAASRDPRSAVTVLAEQLAKSVGFGFEDELSEGARERARECLGLSMSNLDALSTQALEIARRATQT